MTMPIERPFLAVDRVHAAYGKKEILHGVSFTVDRGEVVALFGGNGAGKSTVLKVISGLLMPLKGIVLLDGKDVTKTGVRQRQRLGAGYLLQGGRVFPSLTVRENFAISLQLRPKGPLPQRNIDLGQVFPDLKDLAGRRAGLLSGGQRQMLAIEMVLCQSPRLVLLDEPTGSLSPDLARHILSAINVFASMNNCAVVLVEQNVAEAAQVSNRTLQLREGVVEQLQKEVCQ